MPTASWWRRRRQLLPHRQARQIKEDADRARRLAGELGLDRDGRVMVLTANVLGDVGAYSIYPWTCALEPVQVASFLPGPYRIETYRGAVQAVATCKAPTGPYRGVGRPIATFVTERLLDMAAHRIGIDAREIRLRNFVQDHEFPYRIGSGIVWDRSGFTQCLVAASAAKGKHVRVAGLDFARGAVLLKKGRRLSDRDLALAAAMNHPTVPVHRPAKVAVLATGDELVMPGSLAGIGEIVYSNGYATMALARREGCAIIDLGIVPDRLPETAAAVRRAYDLGADMLVTSGGASVGDYDLVQKALATEGLELSFWKVALRPGRPMMNGRLGRMHVLGLPGNPVSAYVCAVLFMVPLIRRLAGRSDVETKPEPARLGCDLPANDERADYLRATLAPGAGGVAVATPAPVQDSSMLTPLARADCLLIREPHAPAAKTGSDCLIIRLAC